ncbi:MAG: M1 family metallopeptidase [Pseudohongiellaceae bacterium]
MLPRLLCVLLFAFSLQSCVTTNAPLHPVTALSSGELSPLQALYDVKHYQLEIEVFPESKTITGLVSMTALALVGLDEIELDLDPRFIIESVTVNGLNSPFELDNGKLLIQHQGLAAGNEFSTMVTYHGKPYEAENPPWDGGFVWNHTASGEHWIATAVQGRGCDLYWPCKDHISDKPELGADMIITVPSDLKAVMNGVLVSESYKDDRTSYHWKTSNPISAYHLAINIGPFKKFETRHQSALRGDDDSFPVVFYYVSDEPLKVKSLVENDFLPQLEFYERTLGPYPWGNEKIGIVEIPYLGMEHQTMNGYGNQFRLDPEGFDWLMQHEFAHEWFGNLMTQEASRDFWLHEGFANYMQPIYAQEVIGDAGFWSKMWRNYNAIASCKATVPAENVSMDYFDSNDPYFKGSWTLHTLRWLMGEEKFWNAVRRLVYGTTDPWSLSYPIAPSSRSTEDFLQIVSDEYGEDLKWFFDAYLYSTEIPTLSIDRTAEGLRLSFADRPELIFDIPVKVIEGDNHVMTSIPSDGSLFPLALNARILVDPEVKIFREFGTALRCTNN